MVKQASSPDFCPPIEEGRTFVFHDERGDAVELEFLGLILHRDRSYAFFFPVDERHPACSSGEIVLLEVVGRDTFGQPDAFELVEDEAIAREVYEAFKKATRGLYEFV